MVENVTKSEVGNVGEECERGEGLKAYCLWGDGGGHLMTRNSL